MDIGSICGEAGQANLSRALPPQREFRYGCDYPGRSGQTNDRAISVAERNLVLGTAFGYPPKSIRLFVRTLRQHFDGHIALLVTSRGEHADDLAAYLRSQDVEPVYFDAALWMVMHIQVARYVRYYEYLRGCKPFDRVMFTDVTDVVFQADPFASTPEGELLCYLEDQKGIIGHCKHNSLWIQQVFGDAVLARLASRRISCSGTTMGTHSAMLRYAEKMLSKTTPAVMSKIRGPNGHDQGVHNVLIHTGELPGVKLVENGQHIFTLGHTPDDAIVIKPDGLYTAEGIRPAVIHQYNYKDAAFAWVRDTLAESPDEMPRLIGISLAAPTPPAQPSGTTAWPSTPGIYTQQPTLRK